MREIHYIDIDEEIISAVGRLRKSGQGENVFIFPKRALILQSIVNLRLLEREAKKLGKKIIVVSQDEGGRKLAEKAGLLVEEYQDQALQTAPAKDTNRFTVEVGENNIPLPEKTAAREARQRSSDIGSDSFFSSGVAPSVAVSVSPTLPSPSAPTPSIPVSAPEAPTKLRVRDMGPPALTSLNSKREILPSAAPLSSFPRPQAPTSDGIAARVPSESRPPLAQPLRAPVPLPTPPVVPPAPVANPHHDRGGRLARFMGEKTEPSTSAAPSPLSTPRKFAPTPTHSGGWSHSPWAWGVLGTLVLVVAIGLGLFVLFPKATITLEPQTAEQVIRFQAAATTEGGNGTDTFSGRIETLERSVQISLESTGTGTSEGSAKARGKIKIYNDFSKDSQPLVATTRFETKDGKIFRLAEGVTVPGVTETGRKRERGMVEATVVADQAGTEYNVTPTTFTIPGFKGGPKYEKFTAESTQAFTGGGSGSSADGQRVVSQDDLNQVKTKALEEAKRIVGEELQKNLQSGEVILTEAMQLTERPGTVSPPLGAAQSNFTYEARFEVKTFIINETMVKERIEKERVTTGGVTLVPHEYDVRYTALLPKYDTGRVDLTIESTVLFQATLDQEKMKQTLLGQDEAGIRSFLEEHPEVERLQVEFHPQLIVSTIPTNEKRVTVEIVSGQETKD